MSEAILQDVRSFIVETFLFGEDDPNLGTNDSFLEQGIVDSTGVLEVVEFIEAEYSLKVHDSELVPENLDSMDKLTAFIERKVAAKEGGA
jgi:acyl carrier protein